MSSQHSSNATPKMKIMAATLYGVTSVSIMFCNKIVLSGYGFPCVQVLAAIQFIVSITILSIAKMCGCVTFPDISCASLRAIFPLPLFFLMNCVFGLSGMRQINLPMFTALRRFSILFTLLCEAYILGYPHSMTVKVSVGCMIAGSIIAASKDLSFNMVGYGFVMANNACTAGNNIAMKMKLNSKDFGRFGVLFYNSLVSLVILLAFLAVFQRDQVLALRDFEYWADPTFVMFFSMSSVLGFLLNYFIYLAIEYTSPLTLTVIGCLKNIVTAAAGMFMRDYIFEAVNFTGIAFSLAASLYYSAVTLLERKPEGAELLPQEDPDDDWSDSDDDFALKDEGDGD